MRCIFTLFLFASILFGCQDKDQQEESTTPSSIDMDRSVEDLTDRIQIKTIQIGSETTTDKNKFHTSYPYTEYDFINTHQEEFAQAYLAEFQKEVDNLTAEAVAGRNFGQHFELIESTPEVIGFLIERYTSYGNNYDVQYFTHLYDLKAEKRLSFSTLFSPRENFDQLAAIARSKTKDVLQENVNAMEGLSSSDKNKLWENMQDMIEEGTEPTDKNYHAFSWDESGNLTIYFDKYQVASGNHGNIEITLSPETYQELVAQKYQYIFHIPSEQSEPVTPPLGDNVPAQKKSKIDCSREPCVAITFDDGPSTHTSKLLDILKAHDVKATFFVLGKSARVQKNTLLRTYREGHQIGNHSWDHKDLQKLSDVQIDEQIGRTNEVIAEITGEGVRVLRPPYGSFNEIVKSKANMPIILWNLDPMDWKDRHAETVAERMSEAQVNGIVLAHDIHKSTVEAIPAVITNLKAKGYHLVTIDNLFSDQELNNGKVYNRRR